MDCGLSCIAMVCTYYKRPVALELLRELSGFNRSGVNLLGITETAEALHFTTHSLQIDLQQLTTEIKLPAILHWDQRHFVVLYRTRLTRFRNEHRFLIADPASRLFEMGAAEFQSHWLSNRSKEGEMVGTVCTLDPSPAFHSARVQTSSETSTKQPHVITWRSLSDTLLKSRWQLLTILLSVMLTSCFQIILPFLTQNLVDVGIGDLNLQFISVILIGQLMLVLSRTMVDFVRTRVLMHMSVRISCILLSDFWIKLTRLPISHFDRHHTGDTLQRLNDSKVIETFVTGNALSSVFSILSFLIFSIILVLYNRFLFLIFMTGSILYLAWICIFISYRRKVNQQSFKLSAQENNAALQLIQGMQELKLNGAETIKRWEWENIQAELVRVKFKTLFNNQLQQAGALFISEGKNVVLTFLSARMVVDGSLSLGAMMSIQYILGQLNSPIEQLISLVQTWQDAKLSAHRLNQIHGLPDEESDITANPINPPSVNNIEIKNLTFAYPGAGNAPVLKNISMTIEEGNTIAIVGMSGSGKTTLLKLLLKFYKNYTGEILVGDPAACSPLNQLQCLRELSAITWRRQCGVVLQDGYIFSDTIARNIAMADEHEDMDRIMLAARIANIEDFILSLPNGIYTKIGNDGMGISHGQRQRLLIARAVYKEPKFLFLDEATNSLDANNEKTIVKNLKHFSQSRTVVVVAHRLSTVKNADKIVVLENGEIIEQGTHTELANLGGRYFQLVKNQLELDK